MKSSTFRIFEDILMDNRNFSNKKCDLKDENEKYNIDWSSSDSENTTDLQSRAKRKLNFDNVNKTNYKRKSKTKQYKRKWKFKYEQNSLKNTVVSINALRNKNNSLSKTKINENLPSCSQFDFTLESIDFSLHRNEKPQEKLESLAVDNDLNYTLSPILKPKIKKRKTEELHLEPILNNLEKSPVLTKYTRKSKLKDITNEKPLPKCIYGEKSPILSKNSQKQIFIVSPILNKKIKTQLKITEDRTKKAVTVFDKTKNRVFDETGNQVFRETENRVFEETKNRVLDETKNRVFDETQNRVFDETENRVFVETKNRVLDETQNRVFDETQNRVFDEMQNRVFDETEDRVFDETQNRVFDETQNRVFDETPNRVFDETQNRVFDETENRVCNIEDSSEESNINEIIIESEQSPEKLSKSNIEKSQIISNERSSEKTTQNSVIVIEDVLDNPNQQQVSTCTDNSNIYTNLEIIDSGKKNFKPKKGTLSFQLRELLRKQKSDVAFWKHECFLEATSNLPRPKLDDEHLIIQLKVKRYWVEYEKFHVVCNEVSSNNDRNILIILIPTLLNRSLNENDVLSIYPPYIQQKFILHNVEYDVLLNVNKIIFEKNK